MDLKGELISYADDTVLLESGKTWDEVKKNTEEDMEKIIDWLDNNNLVLNMKKTNLIKFRIKNCNNEEDIGILVHKFPGENANHTDHTECLRIQEVKEAKYLGVIIDEKLNWKSHLKFLSTKMLKPIYAALQIRNIISKKTKRIIYMALIQSKLQYGISAWGGAYKTNLEPLVRSQKKFLKILYGKPKKYSTKQLFKETGVLTIEELHEINTLKYIKKQGYLQNIQTKIKSTRYNQNTIPLPKINTNVGKSNCMYRGLQNFNKLDSQAKQEIIDAKLIQYKKTIRTLVERKRKIERTV